MNIRAPRGTQDLFPEELKRFQLIEQCAARLFPVYGYREIRTPIFEDRALYRRSTGETTDIVEKQMFLIEDEYALRPEFTPSIVRAVVENNLLQSGDFCKFYSIGPIFRKERPQKGRLRQFHQVNLEAIGSSSPFVEAELISLVCKFLEEIGVRDYQLKINSLGCANCKSSYMDVLRKSASGISGSLCETCRARLDRNPFRILDCKQENCRKLAANLPSPIDNLCQECKNHFDEAKSQIEAPFKIDPMLVRGIDYYTRTVFELTSGRLGAQDALCGGGRYDNLVAELGGPAAPAAGFAAGIERLILAMDSGEKDRQIGSSVFVMWASPAEKPRAFEVLMKLRGQGISSHMEFEQKRLRRQMSIADKLGTKYVLIIGEEEAKKDIMVIKNMQDGSQKEVSLEEAIKEICA